MKTITTLVVAVTTVSQAALANPTSPQNGPLAPGKAAGIAQAQDSRVDKLAVFGAIGLAAVGIYLIVGTHYRTPGKARSAVSTKH